MTYIFAGLFVSAVCGWVCSERRRRAECREAEELVERLIEIGNRNRLDYLDAVEQIQKMRRQDWSRMTNRIARG